MEKTEKNKKMIIIVRCLLLVVGVSLAYFLANSLINGDVTSLKATTAHIHGATLTMEGTLEFSDKNILPGHKNVSILKLTATGNNEVIPYNVVWKGSNNLNTPLNFTVYKAGVKLEVTSSCHQVTGKVNGMNIINEECTISNETNLGTAIATGTIENRGGEDTYSLVDDEIITATSAGTEMYYYVVLEYPETGEDQSSDMGGTFTGEVMVTESNVSPDINILAVYTKDDGDADYKKVEAIPQSGYTLNTSKSNCTNGATPSWDYDHNGLLTTNLTQSGTSCYLYFDKQIITANTIIANLSGTPTDDSMFSGTSGDGIYTWTKGDYSGGEQPIKYFRGNVNNNWVIFGKDGSNYIWWRIIRNNSNGSLRMIYAGLSNDKNTVPATTGEGTQIGTKAFNSIVNDNMYVGFKYTSGQVHGTGTNSTILGEENSTDKTTLYGWYNATLGSSLEYFGNIDLNAGFCNDRTPTSGTGLGTTETYYAAYNRLVNNKNPNLLCTPYIVQGT